MTRILQLALVAATPAQQFDLVCSGIQTSESVSTGRSSEPYSYRYRFDLAAGKYCEAACKGTRDIVRVSPVQITLADSRTDTPREQKFDSSIIDRETGKQSILYSVRDTLGLRVHRWEGQCEKRPFTGFPEVLTKF